jgi:RNA ligase
MMAQGYVREQVHPAFPNLRILNYTEKAQFDGEWNDVTENCRGLIFDDLTKKVLARPFRKFFNYGQSGCPEIDLNAQAVVTDKMDGSLGILYQTPDGNYAIATRGSFVSDQAIHATKILNGKYAGWLKGNKYSLREFTPLFEIIYPENRIVCDYQGMDDLVLLGMTDMETDYSWSAATAQDFFDWDGPVTETFTYKTMAEALAATPRPGKEGFVVFFPDTDQRVKIKQEDYIALHRIVTGLNARTIWQHLADEKPLSELIESLPDEFHSWVREVVDDLSKKVNNLREQIDTEFSVINRLTSEEVLFQGITDPRVVRRTFASFAATTPFKSFMFSKADGKSIESKLWEMVKPKANVTPGGKVFTEDNA